MGAIDSRLFKRNSIAKPHRQRSTLARREEWIGWLFVSPWVIGFVLLTAGPMLASLGLSFTEATLLSPPRFVGLDNYRMLFSTDEVKSLFWKSLSNTSYYVFLSVPLTVALGFAMALLLNQDLKGQGIFRTIYYLPSIMPPVAVATVWTWVFNKQYGLLNAALAWVGIEGPAWLTSVEWSKPALVISSVWTAGGGMLVFLAGLQGVPTDLYDAAKVDGAGVWSRFRHVTLPMVSSTIFFVLVTSIITSFQVFVIVFVFSGAVGGSQAGSLGGPANSTLMYVVYLYRLAFKQFRMGFASALAWIYFVILMVFTALVFKSSSAWVYYEGELLGGGDGK